MSGCAAGLVEVGDGGRKMTANNGGVVVQVLYYRGGR